MTGPGGAGHFIYGGTDGSGGAPPLKAKAPEGVRFFPLPPPRSLDWFLNNPSSARSQEEKAGKDPARARRRAGSVKSTTAQSNNL